jgi:predicted HicB family RNase H-like nuclease
LQKTEIEKEKAEFEEKIEEYLALKGRKTRESYKPAFRKFLIFYRPKYGKDAGFVHFLKRIFEDLKRDPLDRERVAEVELKEKNPDIWKELELRR